MPATVVTSQNITDIAQGKTVEKVDLPPMRREVIALKRSEQAKPADSQVKVDDKTETKVQGDSAAPTAKPKIKLEDIPEDQLPEHVRKIIGKKHREMKEATEFAEFQRLGRLTAEKRAQELEAELEKLKPKPAEAPPAKADKPKAADFANVAEYTDAVVAWTLEQREAKQAQSQTETAEAERQAKAQESWQKRLEKAMEDDPTYIDTVSAVFAEDNRVVAKSVIEYIQESDFGTALLLHLATNADDMAKFRALNAEKAIGFLGRLEAKLESPVSAKPAPETKAEAPVKKVTQAPAPVDTSQGSAEVVRKDPSAMTTAEYLAHKRAERASKRR